MWNLRRAITQERQRSLLWNYTSTFGWSWRTVWHAPHVAAMHGMHSTQFMHLPVGHFEGGVKSVWTGASHVGASCMSNERQWHVIWPFAVQLYQIRVGVETAAKVLCSACICQITKHTIVRQTPMLCDMVFHLTCMMHLHETQYGWQVKAWIVYCTRHALHRHEEHAIGSVMISRMCNLWLETKLLE